MILFWVYCIWLVGCCVIVCGFVFVCLLDLVVCRWICGVILLVLAVWFDCGGFVCAFVILFCLFDFVVLDLLVCCFSVFWWFSIEC